MSGRLLLHAHLIPGLEAIVLFGSSVDGTFDKRSDIDLLFLIDTPHDPERTHLGAVLSAVNEARRGAGVDRDVNPVLARAQGPDLDQDFLFNVAAHGIVVWGRPSRWIGRPPNAGPHVLIHYRTDRLTPAQKARVQRVLFGQKGRKAVGGKVYKWSTPGLVTKHQHPTPGTLLLPAKEARAVVDQLRRLGARVEQRRCYLA